MRRLMLLPCVAGLGAILVAPAAMAEACPDARLASTIERNTVVASGDATQLQAALQTAEADMKDCAGDPHVMMLVALQLMTGSDRIADPGVKLYTASRAYQALHYVGMSSSNAPRVVTMGAATPRIDIANAYQYRGRALTRVFELERATNSLSMVSTPDLSARMPMACNSGLVGDAQTAQMIQRELPAGEQGLFGFLDNVVETCHDAKGDLLVRALSERAKAYLSVYDKARQPADKWTILQILAADEAQLRKLLPEGGGAWWPSMYPDIIRDRIVSAATVREIDIAFEHWFEPDYIANMMTEVRIGMALDAAYAEDMSVPAGQQKRWEAYRAVLGKCKTAIEALPASQQPAARAMLLRAVEFHRSGKYRRPANAALHPPVEAFSQWLRVG